MAEIATDVYADDDEFLDLARLYRERARDCSEPLLQKYFFELAYELMEQSKEREKRIREIEDGFRDEMLRKLIVKQRTK